MAGAGYCPATFASPLCSVHHHRLHHLMNIRKNMDSDTDTASDSSQDGTYAHDFLDGCLPASESTTLSGTTQDTETLMSNMCDGINLICGLNLSEVELTPIVHNDIQQASTSISLFLDQIILPSSNVDYYDTIDGFQELCQTEVLERLFELRRVFHAIASREVQKRNAAVVCWVDDLLARLGEAVRRFIEIIDTRSASPRTIEQPLSTLQTWREDLALRAAAQLPREWLLDLHSDTDMLRSKFMAIKMPFLRLLLQLLQDSLQRRLLVWSYE
ncbi:hypothetical protein BDW22DRAFT_114729 [Trametopsis cervina]|nr:hypothetical protein BDW22DRAFT_114729 [Trametopsis cervina]